MKREDLNFVLSNIGMIYSNELEAEFIYLDGGLHLTCYQCAWCWNKSEPCDFAWDLYCSDGDCLAEK